MDQKERIIEQAMHMFVSQGIKSVRMDDIAQQLGLSQPAVSHQLRVLKMNKLVKSRREGKNIFYALADDHVRLIIDQGMEHIQE